MTNQQGTMHNALCKIALVIAAVVGCPMTSAYTLSCTVAHAQQVTTQTTTVVSPPSDAQARGCTVADPTPTPLNVRTAPYGRILGALDNGQSVYILDHAEDRQFRTWVYVADPETDKPLGWVYRDYIVCKGER